MLTSAAARTSETRATRPGRSAPYTAAAYRAPPPAVVVVTSSVTARTLTCRSSRPATGPSPASSAGAPSPAGPVTTSIMAK